MEKINLKELGVNLHEKFVFIARDADGDIFGYEHLPEYDSEPEQGQWLPDGGGHVELKNRDLHKVEPLLKRGGILEIDNSFIKAGKDSIYFIDKAKETQTSRAGEYDTVGEKERNMQKIVDMFNACTGKSLTESEGYLFMECLKNVRLFNAPDFHEDSAVDGVSYASLKAEAKAREHGL